MIYVHKGVSLGCGRQGYNGLPGTLPLLPGLFENLLWRFTYHRYNIPFPYGPPRCTRADVYEEQDAGDENAADDEHCNCRHRPVIQVNVTVVDAEGNQCKHNHYCDDPDDCHYCHR